MLHKYLHSDIVVLHGVRADSSVPQHKPNNDASHICSHYDAICAGSYCQTQACNNSFFVILYCNAHYTQHANHCMSLLAVLSPIFSSCFMSASIVEGFNAISWQQEPCRTCRNSNFSEFKLYSSEILGAEPDTVCCTCLLVCSRTLFIWHVNTKTA